MRRTLRKIRGRATQTQKAGHEDTVTPTTETSVAITMVSTSHLGDQNIR
jgi:hypothetical protein